MSPAPWCTDAGQMITDRVLSSWGTVVALGLAACGGADVGTADLVQARDGDGFVLGTEVADDIVTEVVATSDVVTNADVPEAIEVIDAVDQLDLIDDEVAVDDAGDTEDGVDAVVADVQAPCVGAEVGSACTLGGYVPPCYEGRCNARETCVLAAIEGCCRFDADCPPDEAATACETPRCVAARCTLTRVPGCCADDPASCVLGTCDAASGRCDACPAAPCPDAAPLLVQRFDAGAWPLSVTDYQGADQVGWQIDSRRWASGGAAGYLGNPRCRTYYGGTLDAMCAPAADGEQDSGRVQVITRTQFVSLPADEPAVATVWLWAEVEPARGLGVDAEPDLLRVRVEPSDGSPSWLVATSLDVGKSTGGAWRPMLVDLAPWAGRVVRLQLELDTFDGEDNRYEGVWIDELVVTRACADGGCCEADLECPGDACTLGRCVGASSGTGGRCLAGPREPNVACTACESDAACDDGDPCTADRCAAGRCEHDAFCCLERDVFVHDAAVDGLASLVLQDDDPSDGVAWQVDDGALALIDPATDTYASSPPGKPVSARFTTSAFTVPIAGAAVGVDLELSLSTEWDLWTGATFENPAGLDRLVVSVVDQALVNTLWTSDTIAGTTLGQPIMLRLDLEAWRGRAIQIRVAFASGDADQNGFPGPRITRITAGSRCGTWTGEDL